MAEEVKKEKTVEERLESIKNICSVTLFLVVIMTMVLIFHTTK